MRPKALRLAVLSGAFRRVCLIISSSVLAVGPGLTALAQSVDITSGSAGTNVSQAAPGVAVVTTTNIQGATAFNQFDRFNIGAGQTASVIQPAGTTALVNIINGGASNIAGTLNAQIAGAGRPDTGGNHYYVNRDGFVVSAGGVINAGALTLTTPHTDFQQALNDEAQGIAGSAASGVLFQGQEPLNAGAGIEVYGEINARRLELRAGARLLVDGRIRVDAPADQGQGAARPAVNSQGQAKAGGVVIKNGVVHLVSPGDITLRGNVSVKRGNQGGALVTRSGGNTRIGATIDVKSGPNADMDSGSVIIFTEGTANLEAATRIEASSYAGDGGTVTVTSGEKTTLSGVFQTAGVTRDQRGSVLVSAQEIETQGTIRTDGGDLLLFADDPDQIAADDNSVGLIHLAGTLDTTGFVDLYSGTAGDLVIHGDRITNAPGLVLNADAFDSQDDGAIVLVAQATDENNASFASAIEDVPLVSKFADLDTYADVDDLKATIDLIDAEITAGAVIVNARAENVSVLSPDADEIETKTVTEAAGLDDTWLTSAEAAGEKLKNSAVKIASSIGGTFTSFIDIFGSNFTDVEATVTLTNVDINATGGWSGVPVTLTSPPSFTGSATGPLGKTGIEQNYWYFGASNPYSHIIALPAELTDKIATDGGIYVQSHAGSTVDMSSTPYLLGLSITATNAKSLVRVTDSVLTSENWLHVTSTASENHSTSTKPKAAQSFAKATQRFPVFKDINPNNSILKIAFGLNFALRSLENQTLILNSDLTAKNGDMNIAAHTGRSHSQKVITNLGKGGLVGISIGFSYSDGLTEVAIGGDSKLDASGDIVVNAETLYFEKNHEANTLIGSGVPNVNNGLGTLFEGAVRDKFEDFILGAGTKLLDALNAETKNRPETEEKPKLGVAIAADIQIDNQDTRASIGGQYTDLTLAEPALVDLGAATVTAGDKFAITSTQRFATLAEGGGRWKRDVTAAVPINHKLTELVADALGKTEEDLTATFDKVTVFAASFGLMTGDTTAEIGDGATVRATEVVVNARTSYFDLEPLSDALDAVENVRLSFGGLFSDDLAQEADKAGTPAFFDTILSLDQSLNPFENFTTYSAARAVANAPSERADDAGEQKFSLGITGTVVNTVNTTLATIRSGADVTTMNGGGVTVNALATAQHLHLSNVPTTLPGQTEKVNDSLGGSLHFVGIWNTTEASIESGAKVESSGDVDVTAKSDIIQALATYSGGGASSTSINGSIGLAFMSTDTIARIGGAADVSGDTVTIAAKDVSRNVNAAGASSSASASESGSKAVGASVAVNFAERDIYAGIGAGPDRTDPETSTGFVIIANNIDINATNEAIDLSLAAAGTVITNSPEYDPDLADWLLSDDAFAMLLSESDNAAPSKGTQNNPPASGAAGERAGWSIAGAAALNLSLNNSTVAEIDTSGIVSASSGSVTLDAVNKGVTIAGAGAVALGLAQATDTNAIGGSIAVAVDTRDVVARIKDAYVWAAHTKLNADDLAVVVNIAVGAAGTTRGKKAVAGSVAVATLTGDTKTELTDAKVNNGGALTLDAKDHSITVGVAGAAGLNFDQTSSSPTGVGIGIAVNTITRSTLVNVNHGSELWLDGAFNVTATSLAEIYGFGVAAGAGQSGIAGSITVNTVTGGAKVQIGAAGSPNTMYVTSSGVTIKAIEDNKIVGAGGALAVGIQKPALGGAIVVNTIVTETYANAEAVSFAGPGGSIVSYSFAGPELIDITLSATSESRIWALVAAAGGSKKNALAAGAGSNVIQATSNVSFAGSDVEAANDITFTATNTRKIWALSGAGGVAFGGGAGGGAAVLNLLLSNDTKINLDEATIEAAGNFRAAATGEGDIKAAAAGIAIAETESFALTGAANVITGTTGITANDTVITANGTTFEMIADETSNISNLTGSVATSKNAAGAALSVNVLLADAKIQAADSSLRGTSDATIKATNSGSISAYAAGVSASANISGAGSIAIADIGNDAIIDIDADDFGFSGTTIVLAEQTSTISVLAGAAAGSLKDSVGGAVTVTHLHNQVTADLDIQRLHSQGDLSVTAQNNIDLDVYALAAAISGTNGAGLSFAYTQIGTPAGDFDPTNDNASDVGSASEAKPAAEAETLTKAAGTAAAATAEALMDDVADAPASGTVTPSLDEDDTVRARLSLAEGQFEADAVTVNAKRIGSLQVISGAASASFDSGAGVAGSLNLIYGGTEAEFILPASSGGQAHSIKSANIAAIQTDTVNTYTIGGSASLGEIVGAGGVVVNVFSRRTNARIRGADGQANLQVRDGVLSVASTATSTFEVVAGVVSGSGGTGVGGAVAVNAITDDVGAEVSGLYLDGAARPNDASSFAIGSTRTLTLNTVAVAGAGGAQNGFAGSAAISVVGGDNIARIKDSNLTAESGSLVASNVTTLSAIGGGVGAGATSGAGAGIAVNHNTGLTQTSIEGSRIAVRKGFEAKAYTSEGLSTIAIGGAAAGKVALAGSAATSISKSTTQNDVTDSQIYAGGDIRITAFANTIIGGNSGGDQTKSAVNSQATNPASTPGPSATANFAFGGKVGVGLSVTVNDVAKVVETKVTGSQVSSFGREAGDYSISQFGFDNLKRHKGVLIEAQSETTVKVLTITGGAAVAAGLSGIYVYNSIDDTAQTRVGDDTGTITHINKTIDLAAYQYIALGLTDTFGPVRIAASAETSLDAGAYAGGLGAFAGGLTVVTNFVGSAATIALDAADINSNAGGITLAASEKTDIDSAVVGFAAGGGALGGAIGVTELDTDAVIAMRGTTVRSTGPDELYISAMSEDTLDMISVAASLGGVAGGGAVQVSTLGGQSTIAMDALGGRETTVSSIDDVVTLANRETEVNGTSAAAAVSGMSIALSANVTQIEGKAGVTLNGATQISADQDVGLGALTSNTLTGVAGAGSIGVASGGGGLDYVSLSDTAKVTIGADSEVTAERDVQILARTAAEIDSTVATGSLGTVGLAGSLSIVDIGGAAERNAKADEILLASDDAAKLQNSTAASNDPDATDEDERHSAANLAAMAGGEDARSNATLRQQGLDLTTGPTEQGARVEIGTDAVVEAKEDLSVVSQSLMQVAQVAGGAQGSLVAGANFGLAFTKVDADAKIIVGDGARLAADEDIMIKAQSGNLGSPTSDQAAANEPVSIVDSTGFSAGGSVIGQFGAGVAKATVDGEATVDLGDNVQLVGVTENTDGQKQAENVEIKASRTGAARTDVVNINAAFAGAIGVAVVDSTITGGTKITGTNLVILAKNDVDIAATDDTRADSYGMGVTVAGLAGNGVEVTASNTSVNTVDVTAAALIGDAVSVTNRNENTALAWAQGVNAGALAIGASVADASLKADVTTRLSGTIVAENLTVDSDFAATDVLREDGGATASNVESYAISSAGALIAGNGADAESTLDYNVQTTLGGLVTVSEDINATATSTAKGFVEGTGKQGGLVAFGVVKTALNAPRANVGVTVEDATLISATNADVRLVALNKPTYDLNAVSGSGGLVSFNAAVRGDTDITQGDTKLTIDGSALWANNLTAKTDTDFTTNSTVDGVNASLVGASGVAMTTDVTADNSVSIANGSVLVAFEDIDIKADHAVTRILGDDESNLKSGSGGALDVAAMNSTSTLDLTTGVDIEDDVYIWQLGSGTNEGLSIGLETDINFADRMTLDAGGVILIPLGRSTVTVNAGDSELKIGDATLTSLGELDLYAGGNADVRSEVYSNTYGLAGAALAIAKAEYDAGHTISFAEGAEIVSEENIAIRVGQTEGGIQSINVLGEGRAFNRSLIPVNKGSTGSASATTRGEISIKEGAELRATGDVSLFVDAGTRTVKGYGQTRDLYEAAAGEIATGFSTAFGGDPVNLSIENDDTTDTSNDKVTVNGTVRAGARNQRKLTIFEDGTYSQDDEAEGIDVSFEDNYSPADQLSARIAALTSAINNEGLKSDPVALAKWQAERDILIARRADEGSFNGREYEIGNITAREGNIDIRADYVYGGSSGELIAPGNALIDIRSHYDGYLKINDLTIPTDEGGLVTFNGSVVENPTDVRAVSTVNTLPLQTYTITSGANTDAPEIIVATTGDDGTITIVGDVTNLRGAVRVASNKANLVVEGSINALTPILTAPNGNFYQISRVGLTNIGPNPKAQYQDYFDKVQQTSLGVFGLDTTISDSAHLGLTPSVDGAVSSISIAFISIEGSVERFDYEQSRDTTVQAESEIIGKNVFIVADKLNINGLIEAGRSSFETVIKRSLESILDGLNGSGAVTLAEYDALTGTVIGIGKDHITTDVTVKYDQDRKTLIVDDMIVEGGLVDLTGHIMSTGRGEIRSLDGFGTATITNNTTHTLELNRIDTGSSENPDVGVEGLVRIRDLNRVENGQVVITEYRQIDHSVLGSVVKESTISAYRYDTDADGNSIRIPTNVTTRLITDAANDNRRAYYTPVDQDLVVVETERRVAEKTETETTTYFFFQTGIESETTTNDVTRTSITNDLVNAPYVELVDNDPDRAAYRLETERYKDTTILFEQEVEDNRFLGIGSVVKTQDRTETTEVRYSHHLRADKPIAITFGGLSKGVIDIETNGKLVLTDQIVNRNGTTLLNATQDVIAASTGAQLVTDTTEITSTFGRIGGATEDAFLRMNQVEGGIISASSNGDLRLQELDGEMALALITTHARTIDGDVTLIADGDIRGTCDACGIQATKLNLTSKTGSIFGASANETLRINPKGSNAELNAQAFGDITLSAIEADLPVRAVTSLTGDVSLYAPLGRILDVNPIETADIRTQDQLVNLWTNDLGLITGTDGAAARRQAALDAQRAAERARYVAYWNDRAANNGHPSDFVMDPDLQARLTAMDDDGAALNRYLTDRTTRQAEWNAQTAFDPDYVPVLSAETIADVTRNDSWTVQDLQRSLSADLIRRTAATQTRIEEPNITAKGDIYLFALGDVGETLPSVQVLGDGDITLSTADLVALAAAERGDIEITDGRVTVGQRDDVNVAFTDVSALGSATGHLEGFSVAGDILVGARTPITIGARGIFGSNLTQIKSEGLMDRDSSSSSIIRGQNIILESGADASIGRHESAPVLVSVAGGTLDARAGVDLNIEAPTGDLPIDAIFAGNNVTLKALGNLYSTTDGTGPRIVANKLLLDAQNIGTADTFLEIEAPADLYVISKNNAYLRADHDVQLSFAYLGGGGEFETTGDIIVNGNYAYPDGSNLSFGMQAVDAAFTLDADGAVTFQGEPTFDVVGDNLTILAGAPVTSENALIFSQIDTLTYISDVPDTQAAPFRLRNTGDLKVSYVRSNLNDGSRVDLSTVGDMQINYVATAGSVQLAAFDGSISGATTSGGTIIASDTVTYGEYGISDVEVIGESLIAQAGDGPIEMDVRTRSGSVVPFELLQAKTLIDGDITINSQTDINIAQGNIVQANGSGGVRIAAENLNLDGTIRATGTGNVQVETDAAITMGQLSVIAANSGPIFVEAGSDAAISQLYTANENNLAITLVAGGQLSKVGSQDGFMLDAPGTEAGAYIDVGSILAGPLPLKTNVSNLLAVVDTGEIDIFNARDLDLNGAITPDGNITIGAAGDLRILTATAHQGRFVGRASGIVGGPTDIAATEAHLIALNGEIGGSTPVQLTRGLPLSTQSVGTTNVTALAGDLRLISAVTDVDLILNATGGGISSDSTLTAYRNIVLGALTGIEPLNLDAQSVAATTTEGPVALNFVAGTAPVEIKQVSTFGDTSPVAINADGRAINVTGPVFSAFGDITITADAANVNGNISSAGGQISVAVQNDILMAAGNAISSQLGEIDLEATNGTIDAAVLASGATSSDAIGLSAQRVRLSDKTELFANLGGLTSNSDTFDTDGQTIDSNLNQLIVATHQGDVVFNNAGDLDVVDIATGDGRVDITTQGRMTLERVLASPSKTVHLVAGEVLRGRNIVMQGSTLNLEAESIDITAIGDQVISSAQARNGDLDFFTDGDLTIGNIQTQGEATLSATNNLLSNSGWISADHINLSTVLGDIGGSAGTFVATFKPGAQVDASAFSRIAIQDLGGSFKGGILKARDLISIATVGEISDGTFFTERTTLTAEQGIGDAGDVRIIDGILTAHTSSGGVTLAVGDNFSGLGTDIVTLEGISAKGDGEINVTGQDTDVILAGTGIHNEDGMIRVRAQNLTANANITSQTGDITVTTENDLIMKTTGTNITANDGRITVDVDGNLLLGYIQANAVGKNAIDLDVEGTLSLATAEIVKPNRPDRLIAEKRVTDPATGLADAGHVNLEIGSTEITGLGGHVGLLVRSREVDVLIEDGDLHINNSLLIENINAEARNGDLDIYAGGGVTVGTIKTAPGFSTIVTGGSGGVDVDGAVIESENIGLFSFKKAVTGKLTATSGLGTAVAPKISLRAHLGVDVTLLNGDFEIPFAYSAFNDVKLTAANGALNLGVTGLIDLDPIRFNNNEPSGDLILAAQGDVTVGRVGGVTVQPADRVAQKLIFANYDYIPETLLSVDTMAISTPGTISVGLAAVNDSNVMTGSEISAVLANATPANGLTVTANGPDGTFAAPVSIDVRGPITAQQTVTDHFDPALQTATDAAETFDGAVVFSGLRVGSDGSTVNLSSGGTRTVIEGQISGPITTSQRDLTALAQLIAGPVSPDFDIQMVANEDGYLNFALEPGATVTVQGNTLVLNQPSNSNGQSVTSLVASVIQDALLNDAEVIETQFRIEDAEELGSQRRIFKVLSVRLRLPDGSEVVRIPAIRGTIIDGEPDVAQPEELAFLQQ